MSEEHQGEAVRQPMLAKFRRIVALTAFLVFCALELAIHLSDDAVNAWGWPLAAIAVPLFVLLLCFEGYAAGTHNFTKSFKFHPHPLSYYWSSSRFFIVCLGILVFLIVVLNLVR